MRTDPLAAFCIPELFDCNKGGRLSQLQALVHLCVAWHPPRLGRRPHADAHLPLPRKVRRSNLVVKVVGEWRLLIYASKSPGECWQLNLVHNKILLPLLTKNNGLQQPPS